MRTAAGLHASVAAWVVVIEHNSKQSIAGYCSVYCWLRAFECIPHFVSISVHWSIRLKECTECHTKVIFKHGAATSERSDPWKGAEEDQPPLQTAKANHNLEQEVQSFAVKKVMQYKRQSMPGGPRDAQIFKFKRFWQLYLMATWQHSNISSFFCSSYSASLEGAAPNRGFLCCSMHRSVVHEAEGCSDSLNGEARYLRVLLPSMMFGNDLPAIRRCHKMHDLLPSADAMMADGRQMPSDAAAWRLVLACGTCLPAQV